MSTAERPDRAAGVDVGAGRVHAVALARRAGRLEVTGRYEGGATSDLVRFCDGAGRVAVDAPGEPSRGAHREDMAVAAKFRGGRCSEIPVPGTPAVSWVTPPAGNPVPGWMLTGFEVWHRLRGAGLQAVETYPAAAYHRLNGGRWPPRKSTGPGRAARLALLRPYLHLPPEAAGWSHDTLDAAVAALVAATGAPLPHRCPEPDGSRMWLPDRAGV